MPRPPLDHTLISSDMLVVRSIFVLVPVQNFLNNGPL